MSRLLITDGTELRVLDVHGGRASAMPPHAHGALANRQPVWSPDGARVAWSAFDRRHADSPAFVSVADASARTRVDHPLVFPAFYLHWRPDNQAVAALGEGPLGLELTVIDLDTGASEIRTRGAPLFFDWAPDGTLCANVGSGRDQRLELLPDQAAPDPFQSLTPAAFTAPAWRNRDEVIVAVRSEGNRVLVAVDRRASVCRTYTITTGPIRFTSATTARRPRLAWVSGPMRDAGPAPGGGARVAVPDQLVAHDLDTDTTEVVCDRSPIAFTWSPDGEKLLYCLPLERGEPPLLQWRVWSNGDNRSYARFRPSTTFARDYLPFAEQYARSSTWWSPDSDAFCYAGTDADGRSGVFIQTLDGRADRVASGHVAMWSPA